MNPNSIRNHLFERAISRKKESHWPLCLASSLVVGKRDGRTAELAERFGVQVDSIEDWARTYRLYNALRRRVNRIYKVIVGRDPKNIKKFLKARNQDIRDLRELRKELYPTKWLIVADAWKTGLTLPKAMDALRSGADGNERQFAAHIVQSNLTRVKAYKSLVRSVIKTLAFPMPRKEKRKMLEILQIAKKRGQFD